MDSTLSSPKESSATLQPNLGHFAWAVVGSTCVPCLFRENNTKYVPIRIGNTEVHRQFLEKLEPEALNNNWCNVRTFFLTKAEIELLDEINKEHCELVFGEAAFSESDIVVKLDDLIQYHDFLETCYNMLLSERSVDSRFYKCGFLRINNDNDSIVPYVVKNNRKYLPTFYFDGETKSLDAEAVTLENWDLAYLKLCCKAQGIKNDLIASDKCHVISLEQIKLYFTEDTRFDDFWPADALKTLQSTSRVEVNGNHSRGQAPAAGTAGTQQSTSHVQANSHSRGQIPPKGTASIQQSTSRVEINGNHSRGQAPASSATRAPPPSYQSSVSSENQSKRDMRPQSLNYQNTNSFAATMNSSSNVHCHQTSSGPNTAMTNSAATALSRPHPSVQSIRQPYAAQKKNFDPRRKW